MMMEKSDDEQTDGTITDDSDSDNGDRMMKTKTKNSSRGTWLYGFGGGGGGGEGQEDEQEEEKPQLQHDEANLKVPTLFNTKNNSKYAKDLQEYMYKHSTCGDYIVDNVIFVGACYISGDFIEGCLCSTDQILGICQITDFIETSSGIILYDDDDMHDKDCLIEILVDENDDPIKAKLIQVEMKGTSSWLNRTKKPVLPSILKKKKNPKIHTIIPTEEEEQGQEEKSSLAAAPVTATATTTTTTTGREQQQQQQHLARVLKDDAVVVVVLEKEVMPTTTTTAAKRSNKKSVVVVVEKEEEDPSNISDYNNNNDNRNRNRNRNRNNSVVTMIPVQRSLRLENKDSSKVIADNDTDATDATKKKWTKNNKISLSLSSLKKKTKKLNKWMEHFTSSL
ncbi:hypothetical protein FRACYDRAFT_240874 [Fragilariopsis cylindrus CCMP1102]|uniref:Uncharacterized protein n=1 Tax=Fragilariopsis cylindrus CCMP1102 TaxID=635003 RepID=A0A1E7F825_9STRA|nr:hypothetical protein FRACYDRAFT_240874 [Fragilariopsis cylindrus CCMP1102]|eukprot:OEU14338.1 hypothetical protein FRACYDRAFT_240874 [Fragilariopsis cylindrus CCMP1102]